MERDNIARNITIIMYVSLIIILCIAIVNSRDSGQKYKFTFKNRTLL